MQSVRRVNLLTTSEGVGTSVRVTLLDVTRNKGVGGSVTWGVP